MLGPLRKDDDRWLFIPAIKLVTRIAAKDNQSSFVGSDFTYEDVSGRDLGADAYELLREEATAGRDCYVVQSNPKAASAFSRKVSWIDKTSFLPVKEEYYDVQNELFRVFTADEVKEIKGHPTAVRRTMKNLKTGHYTEVVAIMMTMGVQLMRCPSHEELLASRAFTSTPLSSIVFTRFSI